MEEVESSNTIVESRQELMISSTGQETPILRNAHFLKPSLTSNFEESCNLSSLSPASLVPTTVDRKKCPLTVNFRGWRDPPKEWKEWVRKMASLHEPTWNKAGIHEAIMNSTYKIHKHCDLIVGIAERWCPETNSFLLPWGEATVTLEDLMISGFSVLGCPVFKPLETEVLKENEEKLIEARKGIARSSAKHAYQSCWLKKFMDSGSDLEHEAFLSLWLSRFVLPTSFDVICDCVFPIAIHLARGTRIALAPAVLATIYSDLSLLKGKIVSLASSALKTGNENVNVSETVVTAWSPFQLVLVWVWERFIKLRPKPNFFIKNGQPRLARWNNLKCKVENVRLVLESCKQSFIWRPYTKAVVNWSFPKFYREKEMWISIDSGLDEALESFIRCLRVSELVGLGADCIEQYLPHRVARQFGIDQDVPGFGAQSDASREDAWNFYNRPISDAKCYIPSQFLETDVTTRYLEWWKHSVQDLQGVSKSVLQHQKSSVNLKKMPKLSKEHKKIQKFASSFKIRRKSLKPKRFRSISSFIIAPEFSNKTMEGEILKSSFKITRKGAKERQGDVDNVIPGLRSDSLRRSKTLKQKNMDDASVSFGNFRKKSKTLDQSLEKIKEIEKSADHNCPSKSAMSLAEINNLLVPPGFSQKCKKTENSTNILGEQQIHLISEEEVRETSVLVNSMERIPQSEPVENGRGEDNKSASGQYVIRSSPTGTIIDLTLEEDLKFMGDGQGGNEKNESGNDDEPQVVVDPTLAEILKFGKAAARQDGDGKNASGQLCKCQLSPSLSTVDNEAFEVLDPVTSMEKASLNAAAEKRQDSGEISANLLGQSQSHSLTIAEEGSEEGSSNENRVDDAPIGVVPSPNTKVPSLVMPSLEDPSKWVEALSYEYSDADLDFLKKPTEPVQPSEPIDPNIVAKVKEYMNTLACYELFSLIPWQRVSFLSLLSQLNTWQPSSELALLIAKVEDVFKLSQNSIAIYDASTKTLEETQQKKEAFDIEKAKYAAFLAQMMELKQSRENLNEVIAQHEAAIKELKAQQLAIDLKGLQLLPQHQALKDLVDKRKQELLNSKEDVVKAKQAIAKAKVEQLTCLKLWDEIRSEFSKL